jgi:hypothetical protein
MCVSKTTSQGSKRWLAPVLLAFVVGAAGSLDGCGNLECLRNSDCQSHFECHEGACIHPGAPSGGGQTHDASKPEAGAAGEGTGATSSR